MSEHRSLRPCPHCGEKVRYVVSHYYPFNNIIVGYEVIDVYTVLSSEQAEKEGWDPMIFLMENRRGGNRIV